MLLFIVKVLDLVTFLLFLFLGANHLLVMADYLFFLFLVCLVEEKNEGQKMGEEKRGEKNVFGRRMEIEEGTKNSGD